MKHMKVYVVIITILSLLLVVSLILNVVVINKLSDLNSKLNEMQNELVSMNVAIDDMRICDYIGIGLGRLLSDEIIEIYYDETGNPNEKGEVSSEGVITELFDIIRDAWFQKAPDQIIDSAPGSGVFPYIRLTTNKNTYEIRITANTVKIWINDEGQTYSTNICPRLKVLYDHIGKEILEDLKQ